MTLSGDTNEVRLRKYGLDFVIKKNVHVKFVIRDILCFDASLMSIDEMYLLCFLVCHFCFCFCLSGHKIKKKEKKEKL